MEQGSIRPITNTRLGDTPLSATHGEAEPMQLSKTLSALALLGAVIPAAHALSIKDDTVKLGVGIRVQTRATVADSTGTSGEEYRVQDGTPNAVNDPLDFQVRRARLYLKIGYGDNWKGELAMNADDIDAEGSDSGSRNANVRYAWAQRTFASEGSDIKHQLQFGLFKPYNNPTDGAMSSSRMLMPTGTLTAELVAPREVGIEYRFEHPMAIIALDLFNNSESKDSSTADSADEAEGFYYGARAEFSFSKEWFLDKRAESYLGKEGQGANIGVSYASNTDEVDDTDTETDSALGVDVLFWMNSITAYAEYRQATHSVDPFTGPAPDDVKSTVIVIQGGYAIPLENGCVVEPGIKVQLADFDTDDDEEGAEYGDGDGENGGSGTQVDIGLNYYLDGHNNKIQFAVQLWNGEENAAGENADATIIRLQHQLNF